MTTLSVSATGPYGVVIEADKFGHSCVIKSWMRMPNGKFGQIQKHGGVNLGDVLVAINDISVINTPFAEAKAMLEKSMATKVLKFTSSAEYYGTKKSAVQVGKNITGGKEATKHSFLSLIKRSRVNNFASTHFAEYEIVCQLKLASMSVDMEKTFKWSTWKRFSDFERLDGHLRKTLGWHMDTIYFPSSHTFVMSKLSPDFTEQRREELNEYWQKVIAVDKVTEFNKHHCSAALKAFIDVDGALLGEKASSPNEGGEGEKESPGAGGGGDDEEGSGKKGGAEAKRNSSRRLSSRAGSAKSLRRGSATGSSKTLGASDDKDSTTNTNTNTSSSSSSSSSSSDTNTSSSSNAQVSPTAAASSSSQQSAPPPPTPAARPAAVPSSSAASSGSRPPPATGARLNLLGSIAALRKD